MDSFYWGGSHDGEYSVAAGYQILLQSVGLHSMQSPDNAFKNLSLSVGKYRFCPSPDCPSVYRVASPEAAGEPFFCGACYAETCTRCHLEYHPYISCERYKEFKEDPDSSLKEWCKGKDHVKTRLHAAIQLRREKGATTLSASVGSMCLWVCLDFFATSEDCYNHLSTIHLAII
ncbi:hypothetical protein K1719_037511 [Acacia pycnantha]|nr:hypothetical protein K1719_037511 [Acacia pycnantha]